MTSSSIPNGDTRSDFDVVAQLVSRGARVLDIGCADGGLLARLERTLDVDGRGIELSKEGVKQSVARGLSVVQGDADRDLVNYPNDAFDFVILSQTLQATRAPREVLEHLLRIGHRAIVSLPNFGHWRIRMQLLFRGRMPVTQNLNYAWYETPNIHFCTIRDFVELCREVDAEIERAVAFNAQGEQMSISLPWWILNLAGEQAVFLLKRRD